MTFVVVGLDVRRYCSSIETRRELPYEESPIIQMFVLYHKHNISIFYISESVLAVAISSLLSISKLSSDVSFVVA
jgi:hypothetical protein